jgi:hypothetical protein
VEPLAGDLLERIDRYVEELFAPLDPVLARNLDAARAAFSNSARPAVSVRHGLVMDDATDDPSARGARAYNAVIAAHPQLQSIVQPILRDRVDGLAISIVR